MCEVPRLARPAKYPPLDEPAEFTTSAMAQGAIEGDAAAEEVIEPLSTDFKFFLFASR